MAVTKVPDFDAPSSKVLSPAALVHVVLRTANVHPMQDFYLKFFGGRVSYGNDQISFMTYDEEHHRIALVGIPDTAPKNYRTCGLEHIAFSYKTLSDLMLSYRQRKQQGIKPIWCVNHGPTTSLYYRDPDGNLLETQVDNFDNAEDASAFMLSPWFAENPVGTEFDAEELIKQIRSGVDEKTLKKRKEIGPRGLPDLTTLAPIE
ncbi:glyoxalase bleomycin resistance protein dioxygenase [Ilyonectria sp. MPI-CAGE-AT-0026]|nr:glyoxalase bleomycin resistance protein dioxygenase [Ilyonectria sp. MPI-CAGE-AT-0026]